MALVLSDRVQETANAPGTGSVTLLGAVTGFQTFSAGVGNGNTCYYTIADQGGANWEVGIGTYSSSGNTLARTTVLSSSNSGSLVDFTSGTQVVFVTQPAENTVVSSNNPGTSDYVLTSNGSGVAPSWKAITGSAFTRTSFVATAGQTTFSVVYQVGYATVYVNGVLLNGSDYTATNGTTVVLAVAAVAGDIVEVFAYQTNAVTNSTASNIIGGTTGNVVYQSAPNTTAFTPTGTYGQLLSLDGTSNPSWQDPAYGTLYVDLTNLNGGTASTVYFNPLYLNCGGAT